MGNRWRITELEVVVVVVVWWWLRLWWWYMGVSYVTSSEASGWQFTKHPTWKGIILILFFS
jgi:hypothetical protein